MADLIAYSNRKRLEFIEVEYNPNNLEHFISVLSEGTKGYEIDIYCTDLYIDPLPKVSLIVKKDGQTIINKMYKLKDGTIHEIHLIDIMRTTNFKEYIAVNSKENHQ